MGAAVETPAPPVAVAVAGEFQRRLHLAIGQGPIAEAVIDIVLEPCQVGEPTGFQVYRFPVRQRYFGVSSIN